MRTRKIYIEDKNGKQYVIPDDGIEDFDVYDADGNKIFDEDIRYAVPRFLGQRFYCSRMR